MEVVNLEINQASREDLPILIRLYAEMDGDRPLSPTKAEELFDRIAQLPDYTIYIAYFEGMTVGTFSLLFVPTMMHPGFHKSALLDAVTVSPAYRGKGIGTKMIKEAMKMSAAAGCYKMMLSTNVKRDRTHAFYKSLGFQQHGWSFSLQLH